MTKHAKISPSQLYRIIECPGSLKGCEHHVAEYGESPQSSYAAEGEMLHDVTAHKLGNVTTDHFDINKEQEQVVLECVDYATDIYNQVPDDTIMGIETRVKLETFNPILVDTWGTSDVVMATRKPMRVMHVIDWKFGQGEQIFADENDQLNAYSMGAAISPEMLDKFDEIHVHIGQPRLNHWDTKVLVPGDLIFWMNNRLIPGIKRAQNPYARRIPGAKQCRWCDCRHSCTERISWMNSLAGEVFKMHKELKKHDSVDQKDLVALLNHTDALKSCLSDLEKYAQAEIRAGRGFYQRKMVHGRSRRKWVSEEAAAEYLENMLDYDDLYVSKLVSPNQAESKNRILKKDDHFKSLFIKAPGSATLVHENDPREAIVYKTATELFKEDQNGGASTSITDS